MTESTSPSLRRGVQTNQPAFDLNEAAARLVLTYGPIILRDARRFSACTEDAEDAYQRALEILLTKAPSDDHDELVPWVRTVVRNEALAIARTRGRTVSVPLDLAAETIAANDALPEDALDDSLEAELGAEALERLTTDHAHCLLAYSRGHSYSEIAALTGFSARKVARCMTDGRRAFVNRVNDIESGSECERLEPLLQRMADGDSYAHVEARPHLRNCPGCRATLRAYREAPSKLAALFPAALVVPASSGIDLPGIDLHGIDVPGIDAPGIETAGANGLSVVRDHFIGVWDDLQERSVAFVNGIHQWFEFGTAKKLGVAALAAAALTAGGVAMDHGVGDDSRSPARQSTGVRFTGHLFDRIDAPPVRRRATPARRPKKTSTPPPPRSVVAPVAPQRAAAPVDDGSSEFLPEAR